MKWLDVTNPPEEYLFSWPAQARQYDQCGMPGISYFPGWISPVLTVNCLLWRDEHGTLLGILNHYPVDTRWEKRGEVNVFVKPGHTRQGIGRALWVEAERRYGAIRLGGEMDTPDGIAFGDAMLDSKHRDTATRKA